MTGEGAEPGARISVRITDGPIRTDELFSTGSEADGALVVFVGRVRNSNRGRAVERLRYEAYAEMAESELSRIVSEAAARWEVGEIAAVHRAGTLELGETSVAIAVAAPHRGTAYEASRHLIEEIKKRLPIWKREEYADGTAEWIEPPPEAGSLPDSPAVQHQSGAED